MPCGRCARNRRYLRLELQAHRLSVLIHLTRTDPARNMARFYTMALQPTLFGEWALLKEWGRIGSAGRLVSCSFASEEEAALAMAKHLKAKLRRGNEAV